jgi:hypothetical protein
MERMKNCGETEVISLGLDVLFVAELRPRRLLHCNSPFAFAGFLSTKVHFLVLRPARRGTPRAAIA